MVSKLTALPVAYLALLVAGCSADVTEDVADIGDAQWIDVYIERAMAGEGLTGEVASIDQIAILERGRAQGELTLADALEAINNAGTCLDAQGLRLTMGNTYVDDTGFENPSYTWGGLRDVPPEQLAAMGDPCFDAESYFVERAYVQQPRAQELADVYFEEHHRQALEGCFERNAIDFDPEASRRELQELAGGIALEMALDGIDHDETIASGRDCLYETYIRPFETPAAQ